MRINELKSDSYIVDWFGEIKPSDKTKINYLNSMQVYTEFVGKTPEELILEAEADIKAGLLPRERRVKKYLNNFYAHLQDKELADNTIQSHMSAVRSFYTSYDIDKIKLSRTEHAVAALEENLPIPSKSDLQVALKVCDPLERALMLVGVSSGLSINEIIHLKIKQFKEGYDPVTKITTLPMRRYKKKVDFITFLSPEASQAVMDYLDYRSRKTKSSRERRLNQLEKQRVFSDNNCLFCKQNVPNSFLETKNDNVRQLTDDIIMRVYRTISEKTCKNSPDGAWNLIRSHNMRRYFNSAMLNAGADSFFVEFLMGHKLDKTRKGYFRASPEQLREKYQKYIPYLTIQKEEDITVNPIFQKEVSYRQAIESELARTSLERSEMQELKEKAEKEKVERTNELEELRKRIPTEEDLNDKVETLVSEHMAKLRSDKAYAREYLWEVDPRAMSPDKLKEFKKILEEL